MNHRHTLGPIDLQKAIDSVADKVSYRIDQKGLGCFASNHEIYGIIRQETSEYEEAIHERLHDEDKIEELKDIAVACIIGIASIESGGVDW